MGHYATSRKVSDSSPDEVDFFNWPNPSSHTMVLGSTQPLSEMSTRNLPRGKWRPALKADKLTAICEPIVYRKCGSLNVSQPYGTSKPVTGRALPFFFYLTEIILSLWSGFIWLMIGSSGGLMWTLKRLFVRYKRRRIYWIVEWL
jgi:hypothetical protein